LAALVTILLATLIARRRITLPPVVGRRLQVRLIGLDLRIASRVFSARLIQIIMGGLLFTAIVVTLHLIERIVIVLGVGTSGAQCDGGNDE
jgi:hypothetical protein